MKDDFQVASWKVRSSLRELVSPAGKSIRVEPRSMAVLLALAEEPGEVCRREELLDAVWGDRFVTEEVLSHAVWDLRRAFGDDARRPTFIQTIPRTGYRLVAPVARPQPGPEPDSEPQPESEPQPGSVPQPGSQPRTQPPSPPPAAALPAPPTGSGRRLQRRRWLGAAGVAALVVAASVVFITTTGSARPSLRVVVPEVEVLEVEIPQAEIPEAGGGTHGVAGEGLEHAADGIHMAALATLSSLPGVVALDAAQAAGSDPGPAGIARATAADQVLRLSLRPAGPEGGLAALTVRRYLGADGRVLGSHRFEVPTDRMGARLLADTVRAHLLRAYPRHRPEGVRSDFGASDEDYLTFLELRRRLDRGEAARPEDLATAEALLTSSPGFMEAHLLAVRLATQLHRDRRDRRFLVRGRELQARVEAAEPGDPRPLLARFELELSAQQHAAAAETLDRLEERIPGYPRLLPSRAKLLEVQGDLRAARPLRQRAVSLHPSWLNLYHLALLEQRLGEVEAARGHLEALLERAPENRYGWSKLAEIELSHGDLERSAALYRQLLAGRRQRNYLTNLGIALYLQGRHAEARERYRQALELAPGHPVVLLNLAEAELAVGRRSEAEAHFRELVDSLEVAAGDAATGDAAEVRRPARPVDAMILAVALARLEQPRRAVKVTQDTLRHHPDHSEVAYQAAMVYALVGDRQSALVQVERALSLGLRPRWFRVPGFEGLGTEPAFQGLVASRATGGGGRAGSRSGSQAVRHGGTG